MSHTECSARYHDTHVAYTRWGCRCPKAREEARIYRKRLRHGRQPPGRVPALGTARRLRALAAAGYSWPDLAAHLGVSRQRVGRLASDPDGLVYARTAATIVSLFTALAATPGRSTDARAFAARQGWAPPMAWDDIDDPNAVPDFGDNDRGVVDEVAVRRALTGERVRLSKPERLAALRTGLDRGQPLAAVASALRLNYATACALVGVEPIRDQRTAEIDEQVERLAAAGHDQYTISALIGVHRRTVGRSLARIAGRQEARQVAS